MTYVVVDLSVAFKWFAPAGEAGLEQALALLADHRAGAVLLAAPELLRLEVAHGFWKRGATADDLERVVSTLEGFGIEWFRGTAERATHAARLAAEHRLTVYDAAFVALALELDAELVTDDRAVLRSGACRLRTLAAL